MSEYRYVIDAEDRIIEVSENWLSFAQENQAGESCHPDRVINRPIWQFMDGFETKDLYRLVFSTVRGQGKAVTLPYRCDAPDRRRFLELDIVPVPREHLQFISRIIREELRESVELLRPDLPRSNELVKMCCLCKKVELPANDWVEVELAIVSLRLFEGDAPPRISHGYCPACHEVVMAQIQLIVDRRKT
jgi:hypothetical protein